MRGAKAKAIRRVVYKEYSLKAAREIQVVGKTIYNVGRRGIYLRLKRRDKGRRSFGLFNTPPRGTTEEK